MKVAIIYKKCSVTSKISMFYFSKKYFINKFYINTNRDRNFRYLEYCHGLPYLNNTTRVLINRGITFKEYVKTKILNLPILYNFYTSIYSSLIS